MNKRKSHFHVAFSPVNVPSPGVHSSIVSQFEGLALEFPVIEYFRFYCNLPIFLLYCSTLNSIIFHSVETVWSLWIVFKPPKNQSYLRRTYLGKPFGLHVQLMILSVLLTLSLEPLTFILSPCTGFQAGC